MKAEHRGYPVGPYLDVAAVGEALQVQLLTLVCENFNGTAGHSAEIQFIDNKFHILHPNLPEAST